MQIYLIRHGKTEANEKHLYCGTTDLPLSENGVFDLKGLQYQVPENAVFITSGMCRTDQTLELLFGKVDFIVESRFREMDFGIFEMHSYEELQGRPDYQEWISGDNEANICPQGESGHQMKKRVMEAFGELTTEISVVVTHGGTIAAIMESLFPEEGKNRYEWQPRPGEGYVLSGTGGKVKGNWRYRKLNVPCT